jgi:hypothetical protein
MDGENKRQRIEGPQKVFASRPDDPDRSGARVSRRLDESAAAGMVFSAIDEERSEIRNPADTRH